MAETVQPGTVLTTSGNDWTSPIPKVPQKLILADTIFMLKRNQYAFLRYFGIGEKGEGGRKSGWNFTGEITRTLTWLQDKIVSRDTALAAALADGVSTTITVVDATIYRIGDVLKIEDEILRVTSITSGTVFEATRGWAGSTGAAHADTTAVEFLTVANLEGSDIVASDEALPTDEFNVVQNMKDAARVSFAAARIADYGGFSGRMANNIERKLIKLVDGLNNAVYENDVRIDGSVDGVRMMGGLPYYYTAAKGATVIDVGGTEFLYDHIKAGLKSVAQQTSEVPTVMFTDAVGVDAVSEWFAGSVRTEVSEMRGGVVINRIVTPHGELEVIVDYMMPQGHTWILNPDYIDVIPADPFGVYDQTTQGDSYQRMVHGEYTGLFAAPEAQIHIHNYDIS